MRKRSSFQSMSQFWIVLPVCMKTMSRDGLGIAAGDVESE